MTNTVPKQIEAQFTHHGMVARFRARAPREARILAAAMFVGIVLPMIPIGGLIAVGTWWPEAVGQLFAPLIGGIVLTLLAQTIGGPILFNWAGKPQEVVLEIDERTLKWELEHERLVFELHHIREIEAMRGEIRVEDGLKVHRMPCGGLKKPAIDWLFARMHEAWLRQRDKMEESAEDRAERRRVGQLVPHE